MSAPPVEAAAPNWAEITTEPQCPLCEYMLRGLNVARCPECGFRFEWPEVLDASKRDHPYLFEHFPERNVWSYCKTVLGAMRPRRFWSMLHPGQRGSIRRLIIFWLVGFTVCTGVVLLMPMVFIIAKEVFERRYGAYAHRVHYHQPFWSEVGFSLNLRYFSPFGLREFKAILLIIGAWPWILLLSLQLFSESMRKAKVRPVHVLRCMIYSMDLTYLALMLTLAGMACVATMLVNYINRGRVPGDLIETMIAWVVLAALLIYTYRLGVAYRRYLRFDHSAAVAISAQLITALSILSLMFLFTG